MPAAPRHDVWRETDATLQLRRDVRAFIDAELRAGGFTPQVDGWMAGWDREFTRRLAAAGYLGMTIPAEFGGGGRTFLDRFIVNEELLAAGAPLAAHWFADRQVAPALLNVGTPEQQQRWLPAIAAGDLTFAIGMSEPDSGSDLASVSTRARRLDDGTWRLDGTKIWTSNAHRADLLLLLARTAPRDARRRHDGLSQFIVPLDAAGLDVRPVLSMDGGHHFNEVVFDDVRLPADALLGVEGQGWAQVTAELGFERSGPERLLSTHLLLEDLVVGAEDASSSEAVGRYAARLASLHAMSGGVASMLTRGADATTLAGFVKILGTETEGDLVAYRAAHRDAVEDADARARLDRALLARAGFTLRGGTNQILRGVIAREMGMR